MNKKNKKDLLRQAVRTTILTVRDLGLSDSCIEREIRACKTINQIVVVLKSYRKIYELLS